MWGPERLAMLGRMRHAAWLSLLVCAAAAAGTAYKSIGPDGSVVYTDRPAPNAQELRLPEPSTYAPPDLPASRSAPAFQPEPVAGSAYQSVRITAPPNEGTVFAAQGGVDVDVALEPALVDGHTLTYVVDGKEVAKGLRTERVRVTDLDRGTHHVEVAVRDEAGRLVSMSDRITFHLRQPSINDPLRPDDEAQPEQPIEPPPPSYRPPEPPSYERTEKPAYLPTEKPAYTPEKPNFVPPPPPSYVPAPPPAPYAPRYTPK